MHRCGGARREASVGLTRRAAGTKDELTIQLKSSPIGWGGVRSVNGRSRTRC